MSKKAKFIQFSFSDFLDRYPNYKQYFSPYQLLHFLGDPDYFVRFQPSTGLVEIGYLSDFWMMK